MKKILSLFVSTILTCNLFAHALWIETDATGRIGIPQQVNLYFGEYAQNERDDLSKWRSDLKDLTLWLVSPDGAREKLTVRQDSNAVIASFTPATKGAYTLLVNHPLKELSGTAQLEFLACTHVLVGDTHLPAGALQKNIDHTLNNNDLKVYPQTGAAWKVKGPITIQVLVNNTAKAGNTVLVFSPSGWSQELTTAADGTVQFTPLWPGKYVIEAQEFSRTPGELRAAPACPVPGRPF